jgi:hypothetical protein
MSGLLLRRAVARSHSTQLIAILVLASLGAAVVPWSVRAGSVAMAAERSPTPIGPCVVPGANEPDRPATDLRVALARMLGEHAYLLMESMRAETGAPGEGEAARATIDANSASLADAFASVYGNDAGSAFRTLWDRHVVAAIAFARATAAGDTAGVEAARHELHAFQTAFDEFLANANPKLDADDESAAVRLHLEHVEQFAAGDFSAAYASARKAYGHMFDMGDMLARAIAKQFSRRFPDVRIAFSPASELRIYLDRLLGEHLILAAEAMRAGMTQAPDFAATRQALDANAADLRDAIAGIYGDDAGEAFGAVWNAHLVAYLDYVDAVRDGDADRIATVRKTLDAYGRVFGEFMASANPKLSADAVAEMIAMHTASLVKMVDAYRTNDYATANETAAEAYVHMFEVGDALAAAIAAQIPTRFADLAKLPATDTGPAGGHAALQRAPRSAGWWRAR